MSETKTTNALLCIQVMVVCPECDSDIDLMDSGDTDDYDHNYKGFVLDQACPDGSWNDKRPELEVDDVRCTKCQTVFNVEGLEW